MVSHVRRALVGGIGSFVAEKAVRYGMGRLRKSLVKKRTQILKKRKAPRASSSGVRKRSFKRVRVNRPIRNYKGYGDDEGKSITFFGRSGGKLERGHSFKGAKRFTSSATVGVLTCPPGYKSNTSVLLFTNGIGSANRINSIMDHQKIIKNLMAEEPISAAQNSGVGSGDIGSGTYTYHVKSWVVETVYKSATNVPVTMWIYDMAARVDQDGAPMTPELAYEKGVAVNAANPVGGTGIMEGLAGEVASFPELVPGGTPFQSKLFCSFFKVRKVHKFMLHPGSSHSHKIIIKPRFKFCADKTLAVDTRRNQTVFSMVSLLGGIADSIDDPTQVGTAAAKVIYTSTCRIESRTVLKNRTVYNSYNLLGRITDPQTILEDTDIKVPVETA